MCNGNCDGCCPNCGGGPLYPIIKTPILDAIFLCGMALTGIQVFMLAFVAVIMVMTAMAGFFVSSVGGFFVNLASPFIGETASVWGLFGTCSCFLILITWRMDRTRKKAIADMQLKDPSFQPDIKGNARTIGFLISILVLILSVYALFYFLPKDGYKSYFTHQNQSPVPTPLVVQPSPPIPPLIVPPPVELKPIATQPAIPTPRALYDQANSLKASAPERSFLLLQIAKGLPQADEALLFDITVLSNELATAEVFYKIALSLKKKNPDEARGFLKSAMQFQPDKQFTRMIIPLYRELFPEESIYPLQAFADGKYDAVAETREEEPRPHVLNDIKIRAEKAQQCYRNAANLKSRNPKAAIDYILQALELDPDADLKQKLEKLQAELKQPKGKK